MIVQPGGVYGPDDHSAIGKQIDQFLAGKMPADLPRPRLQHGHVDDVADGILLALDEGKAGEAYVLGGEITTMRDLFVTLADVSAASPRRTCPPGS